MSTNDASAADKAAKKGEAAKAAADKPERFIPASEDRFNASAEFTFPLLSYVPVAGTPLAHLMRPEYWANIKALKAGCRIWVFAEDESYWAELLVRRVGQGFALLHELRSGELGDAGEDPKLTDGYEIQYRGPITKHRVLRLADGHVLKSGLDTREDAAAWLREHKRMLAA